MQFVFFWFLYLSALLSILLTIHTKNRIHTPGAIPLAFMAIGTTIFSFFAILFQYTQSQFFQQLIVAGEYIGISMLPPAWFVFSLNFTGKSLYYKKFFRISAISIGTILVGLAGTNGWHELVWHDVERNNQYYSEPWIAYWFFMIYVYGMIIAGLTLIFVRFFNSTSIYRWQCWIVILAGIIPLAINFIYDLGLLSFFPENPAPLSFILSIILIWWGLFKFKILDLTPIAHFILINKMDDGILVLDNKERIVEFNSSALTMFQDLTPNSIGQSAESAIPSWIEIRNILQPKARKMLEIELETKQNTKIIEFRTIPLLSWHGRSYNYLLQMRDITQLRTMQNQVKILSGLLPICSHCKKIRDDQGYWEKLELYLSKHSEAEFTHSLCPVCAKKHYPDFVD